MKSGTPFHPKVRKLARTLGLPLFSAVGILEMLWHYAEKYAPAGDIGKFDDQDIVDAVDWPEEPAKLVAALVDARLVDTCDCHRMIIHDWQDHCNDAVHMKLARAREVFASGQVPKLARFNKVERDEIEQEYAHMHINVHTCTLPSLAKPSPPMPCISSSPSVTVSSQPSEPVKARRVQPTPSQIESIYNAYPRKVGKKDALKAIAKAIKQLDDDGRDGQVFLLDRVMAYAKATSGGDKQFIPHPATWFNRGSYDDDPSEWDKERHPEEDEGASMKTITDFKTINAVLIATGMYDNQ